MRTNGLNPESGVRVLSCVLLDPTLWPKVSAALRPDHFPFPELRNVFEAMRTLVSNGQTIERDDLAQLDRESYLVFDHLESELIPRPKASDLDRNIEKMLAEHKMHEAIHALDKLHKKAADGGITPEDLRKLGEIGAALETPQGRPRAVSVDSLTYSELEFPPREPFMLLRGFGTPVLTARSISQIYGWRGTGKSMLAQALAGHLATGTPFLNFVIPRPRRVLYVDGELPSAQIQERIRILHPPNAFLFIIDLEGQKTYGIPNLATPEGQAWLDLELEDIEVLILDSQATLAPFSVKDSDAQQFWNNWLLRLRARGLAVVTLHQAGKLGAQRLTSANDDPLDVQIKLTAEDEERDHLKCTLHYDKFRAAGRGSSDLKIEFNGTSWSFSELVADKLNLIEEYFHSHPGASARKLAAEFPELGSVATVKRLVRKWRDSGSQGQKP